MRLLNITSSSYWDMFDKHVSRRRRKGAWQKIGANSRRVFVFVVSNFFRDLSFH